MTDVTAPQPQPEPAGTVAPIGARMLGRDTVLYTAGVLLSRLVSFVMLPVYTRMLTPADYGVLQYVELAMDVVSILFVAGLTAGLQRFYFKTEDIGERQQVVMSAFILDIAFGALAASALALAAPLVWRYGLHGEGSVLMIRVAAATLISGLLSAVPFVLMRIERKAMLFVGASLLRLVIQVGLNIFFLVHRHTGTIGILYATLAANLVAGMLWVPWLLRRTRTGPSWKAIQDLRRFGIPYQFVWIADFLSTFGDRFFLQAYRGVAAVGLYSMAYQFIPLLTTVGAGPFLSAWNPIRHELASRPRAERDAHYREGFFRFSLVLVSAGVAISLASRPIILIMTTPAYYGAAELIPPLLLSCVIQQLSESIKFGLEVAERTKYISVAVWAQLLPTAIIYAVLVPPLGVWGAAIGTLAGCVVRLLATYHFAQRFWPVDYELRRPARLLVLAIFCTLLGYLTPSSRPLESVMIAGVAFVLFGAATWIMVLNGRERVLLRALLTQPRALIRGLATTS